MQKLFHIVDYPIPHTPSLSLSLSFSLTLSISILYIHKQNTARIF